MTTKKTDSTAVATAQETAVAQFDDARLREISKAERFADAQLREVKSFEDAMALLVSTYGGVDSVTDYEMGNGFRVLDDGQKERLVGKTFIVLHMQFNEGDFGDFVSLTVVVKDGNERIVVNDGSTGIFAQCKDVAQTGRFGGFIVPRGLRKSEYKTCFECGKPRPESVETCGTCGDTDSKRGKGTTYYLDVDE